MERASESRLSFSLLVRSFEVFGFKSGFVAESSYFVVVGNFTEI